MYSFIDRVIGNMEWIQGNFNKIVHILELGVSDHAMVCIKSEGNNTNVRDEFKFINDVIEVTNYIEELKKSWQRHVKGCSTQRIWNKLMRLQPVMIKLNRPLMGTKTQIEKGRGELAEIQGNLWQDKMNP